MLSSQGDNLIFRIREAIRDTYGDAGEALAVAREVAEVSFGISYVQAFAGTARPLSGEEETRLSLMVERLCQGWPVQYVTGRAEFMGRWFAVSPAVLVPRPETENVVRAAVESVAGVTAPRIVDVGTGSGCIAVSVKLALPEAQVTGVDISGEALAVARNNAVSLGADVTMAWGDVSCPDTLPTGPLDLVVSNPPYVRQSESTAMTVQVREYEPPLALFVPNDDALKFYRALADYGRKTLVQGGALVMEINSALGAETAALFECRGYGEVEMLKDMYGKDRIVRCRRV